MTIGSNWMGAVPPPALLATERGVGDATLRLGEPLTLRFAPCASSLVAVLRELPRRRPLRLPDTHTHTLDMEATRRHQRGAATRKQQGVLGDVPRGGAAWLVDRRQPRVGGVARSHSSHRRRALLPATSTTPQWRAAHTQPAAAAAAAFVRRCTVSGLGLHGLTAW